MLFARTVLYRHISLHPGNIDADFFRGFKQSSPWLKPLFPALDWLISKALLIPLQGALTQLYAATSPEVYIKQLNGAYLEPIAKPGTLAKHATGAPGEVLGKEMITFVKKFAKDSVDVDIDALIQQALAKQTAPLRVSHSFLHCCASQASSRLHILADRRRLHS